MKNISRDSILDFIKKYKLQIICILGGFALYAVAVVIQPGKAENVEEIQRAGYGSKKTENLYIDGLEQDTVRMSIPVEARRFSEDEIDDAMDRCLSDAISESLGDNPSLDEVYYDLKLPDVMNDYGFKLTWSSDNRDVITSSGKVENEEMKEPVEALLHVIISEQDHQKEFAVPVTVMPQLLTESERRQKDLLKLVSESDRKAATGPSVVLPDNYEGKNIRYRSSEDMSYDFIWVLGIIFALLLLLRDKENLKTEQEKRYRQMQLDYPELVSKLLVFVGAGLSVRMAWDAISRDYELSVEEQEESKQTVNIRYAYEEMCRANARLKTGAPEGSVYRDFGRECHSKQYMKLASLLEQNRKSGVANMKSLLQLEMVEAWEERKNLALRQGEEASTKLLIPLFIMLIIVMVIIMVPALIGFS